MHVQSYNQKHYIYVLKVLYNVLKVYNMITFNMHFLSASDFVMRPDK